jgi:hypothetical protein
MNKFLPIILFLFILISCKPSPRFISPDYKRPKRAAILPTINQTNDVKGSILIRLIFYQQMKKKKYTEILDINSVDSILNNEGITDGGQLGLISQNELFKILNVDGLFHIELLVCKTTLLDDDELGKVKVNLKLYKPESKLIWEDEREEKAKHGSSSSGGLSDMFAEYIGKTVAKAVLQGTLSWIFDHELKTGNG